MEMTNQTQIDHNRTILYSRKHSSTLDMAILTSKIVKNPKLKLCISNKRANFIQDLNKNSVFLLFRTRHIQEVVSAYAITAILTIAPLIANFVSEDTLDKCDVWRPRFGENKCFYSGMIKKIFEKISFY